MKTKLFASMIAATLSISVAQTVLASDGTVNFTGAISAQSCTVNSGVQDLNVVLPTVTSVALASPGQTAGSTAFSINLTDCALPTGGVSAFFEVGPNVDITTGRLNPDAGGASGVQILLQNEDFSDIKVGFAGAAQNSQAVPLVSGAATLNYVASYYATGPVTPGPVNSSVTFSIIYE